jgi:ABC-type multidrug transport system fused ATPase/permease subunit
VQFFVAVARASPGLAAAWWTCLILLGLLPALFAIAMGVLVGAVRADAPLVLPLVFAGGVFLLLQVLSPIHQAVSANLGYRTSAWLYDRLTEACVRPGGIGHLEDPALATDLTVAREFDRGQTGPPLNVSMDFIASGLVTLVAGVASAVVVAAWQWWAGLLLAAAWASTHWLLRESGVWRDRNTPEVQAAQRDADYAFRLAVDPPAAKELRLFGLAGWTLDRFVARRTRLHELQYAATRMRQRPLAGAIVIVTAANLVVFWFIVQAALSGQLGLGQAVTFLQAAVGVSAIAFGGLNWALDGASAPVAAVLRLKDAAARAGDLPSGRRVGHGLPAREIRFREVSFAYPGCAPVLDRFDLTIPAGTSLAIVGQNGAGKTTLAKLLCRFYDPTGGAIEVDGVDLRDFDLDVWRGCVTAVFQDFTRFEAPLRDNVAPMPLGQAPLGDAALREALAAAGAADLAALDTIMAKGYAGGVDLSGGQWQRVALARALVAVRRGAGLVLLDEPTAQLDVRGEAEIFGRLLAATRQCTTVLVSHRFSTVRQADRICVVEQGRVVELGSHDELMALGGRYRTMFDLQAQRFHEADEEGQVYETLA